METLGVGGEVAHLKSPGWVWDKQSTPHGINVLNAESLKQEGLASMSPPRASALSTRNPNTLTSGVQPLAQASPAAAPA